MNYRLSVAAATTAALVLAATTFAATAPPEPGLLFYLSGEQGTTADVSAAGKPEPTFDSEVRKIADGARGAALECGNFQQLAWRAPGNIYAQRGTLAFFWRSRYPVGPTEFPLFRVAYADHSSHDMVWLRIDYNGHGFDAFVTDASLARTRVSVSVGTFPAPSEWVHLALSWDETRGIRFYVNGKLAATEPCTPYASVDSAGASRVVIPRGIPTKNGKWVTVYDTALDQFGPHSRLISPHRVVSADSYIRGGDIDELRIYDHMLEDDAVAHLASAPGPDPEAKQNILVEPPQTPTRPAAESPINALAWAMRYGWERHEEPPPYYAAAALSIRKVEIHDAYDLRRWWWKANDGIRETTWPGVSNRSQLPGRRDYFPLPDSDCYVESGQAITFDLPDEPWNHVEIAGAAWGKMELLPPGVVNERASESVAESVLFERTQGRHKTINRLPEPIIGRKIRFVNAEQEQPIGEMTAYQVSSGREPKGSAIRTFSLHAGAADARSIAPLAAFIAGRYLPSERALLIGTPGPSDAPPPMRSAPVSPSVSLPLVHLLLPNTWDDLADGLDGIAIDLPALEVKPTHGDLFPINIRVKDPLWPMRDMLDFTLAVKPGEPKTLWLDLRDRILPPDKGLLITIAGAGADFGADALAGANLRLIFKPAKQARVEHELDRFTQVKDCFAMLVEANPFSPKLNLWVRFETDLKDLLRVNPEHAMAREYAAMSSLRGPRPSYTVPEPPADVPRWAFLQTELLGRLRDFAMWYIDRRQVPYGDFGGGISDDTDMTNLFPGIALMGCEPEKIRHSLHALLEAAYKNGLFTNGLPTNQADQLHTYEEGVNCLGQVLTLDPGSPRQLERAMATTRSVEHLTGINTAGHRHFRTSYYSGTRMALEHPWGATNPPSYLILHPGMLLVDFNGSPAPRKYMLELADGLLAHRRIDASGRATSPKVIQFADDSGSDFSEDVGQPWYLLWAAWKWSGDRRYLQPLLDNEMAGLRQVNANVVDVLKLRNDDDASPLLRNSTNPDEPYRWIYARPAVPRDDLFHWQLEHDKSRLEKIYAGQLEACDLLSYINTEGSLWIDRVGVPTTELQHTRLGGLALIRGAIQPGHTVSWKFAAPANEQSVGIIIPDASPTAFTVIAYNLEDTPVHATMTGWNIDPGRWEITEGIDTNDDNIADQALRTKHDTFERSRELDLVFPPRSTTVVKLTLKAPGTPYWSRPDLGLDPEDVTFRDGVLHVRVHSLGAVGSPPARLGFRTQAGRLIAAAPIPALAAPTDLIPKIVDVILPLPDGMRPTTGTVEITSDHHLEEITHNNNIVEVRFKYPLSL